MERWEIVYQYDEKICNATDDELLKWAEEAATWNEFSMGCLHDLAWRHGIEWNILDEYGDDPEDADETYNRIKAELATKGVE